MLGSLDCVLKWHEFPFKLQLQTSGENIIGQNVCQNLAIIFLQSRQKRRKVWLFNERFPAMIIMSV